MPWTKHSTIPQHVHTHILAALYRGPASFISSILSCLRMETTLRHGLVKRGMGTLWEPLAE